MLNHVEALDFDDPIGCNCDVFCLASICFYSLHVRRHHVHPLVEEANVITREVPDDKLKFRQLRSECRDP